MSNFYDYYNDLAVWEQNAVDQTRSVLQEALRTDSRLVLRTPEEAEENRAGARVPAEVTAGHPAILDTVTFADDFERIMLLRRCRTALEHAKSAVPALVQLRRPEPG